MKPDPLAAGPDASSTFFPSRPIERTRYPWGFVVSREGAVGLPEHWVAQALADALTIRYDPDQPRGHSVEPGSSIFLLGPAMDTTAPDADEQALAERANQALAQGEPQLWRALDSLCANVA